MPMLHTDMLMQTNCQHTLKKIETILGRELYILPTFDNKNSKYAVSML